MTRGLGVFKEATSSKNHPLDTQKTEIHQEESSGRELYICPETQSKKGM